MKKFCTNLFALDLTDGMTKKFQGQTILANNWQEQFPDLEIEGEKTLKEINLKLN